MTIKEKLCPGCFKEKTNKPVCNLCGYDENARRSPLILPHKTELHYGQYLAGRVLGKPGGFGITYLGWDVKLETCVALKEYLPRDLASREPNQSTVTPHSDEDEEMFRYGLDQFLKEARTLAKFDHANVVKVRTYFEENRTAYLVMDYYSGITLEEYRVRQGGKVTESLAVNIMMPILDGLREVHAVGFLHRDIKPQNIYLTEEGRPMLLDFGAARVAVGERSRSLSVILTPGFAPYEQYHRKGEQGVWTDIYACGATLYSLVTGVIPPESIEREKHDELALPATLAPGLSENVNKAIMAALAREPADRPSSVTEFQKMLTAIPGVSVPIHEPPEEKPVDAGKNVTPEPDKENTGEGNDRKGVKKAVIILLLLAVIGFGVWRLTPFIHQITRHTEQSSEKTPAGSEPGGAPGIEENMEKQPEEPEPAKEPEIVKYSLTVDTVPGDATVRITEPEANYSPGVELEPGRYHLEVSRDGYKTERQWVDLSSGNMVVKIRLPEIKHRLVVNTRPSDAEVKLIDPPMAYYAGMELKPGRYRVEVSRNGYRTKRIRADLRDGDYSTTVTLEELTPDKITNSIGMTFKLIHPGSFMMGSPENEPGRDSDEKRHKVILTKKYYIQTTEATQGQWKKVMGGPPPELRFKNCGDDCPVERVSWNDVQEFIRKLNRMEKTDKYRLPTEAEWEYACRAGTNTPFSFGNCMGTHQANYDGNYPQEGCSKGIYLQKTVPVAGFPPNNWGLYDMHGNVWEWCQDWKGDYPSGTVTDPVGPSSGSYRVGRGGGWNNYARNCRSADRDSGSPDNRGSSLGFRLLRTP